MTTNTPNATPLNERGVFMQTGGGISTVKVPASGGPVVNGTWYAASQGSTFLERQVTQLAAPPPQGTLPLPPPEISLHDHRGLLPGEDWIEAMMDELAPLTVTSSEPLLYIRATSTRYSGLQSVQGADQMDGIARYDLIDPSIPSSSPPVGAAYFVDTTDGPWSSEQHWVIYTGETMDNIDGIRIVKKAGPYGTLQDFLDDMEAIGGTPLHAIDVCTHATFTSKTALESTLQGE